MHTHHITLGNPYDNALCNYTIFPANHTLIPNQIYLKNRFHSLDLIMYQLYDGVNV